MSLGHLILTISIYLLIDSTKQMKLLLILLAENYSLTAWSQEQHVIQLSFATCVYELFGCLKAFSVFCSLALSFLFMLSPGPCQHVIRLPILLHVAVMSALCGHGTLETWFIHSCQLLPNHWPNECLITIARRR